jgi:hypothetical protein
MYPSSVVPLRALTTLCKCTFIKIESRNVSIRTHWAAAFLSIRAAEGDGKLHGCCWQMDGTDCHNNQNDRMTNNHHKQDSYVVLYSYPRPSLNALSAQHPSSVALLPSRRKKWRCLIGHQSTIVQKGTDWMMSNISGCKSSLLTLVSVTSAAAMSVSGYQGIARCRWREFGLESGCIQPHMLY